MSDTRTMRTMPGLVVLAAIVAGGWSAHGQVSSAPLGVKKPSAAMPLNTMNPAAAPVTDFPSGLPRASTPAQRPSKRAEISYANSLLTVKAENSSLNQILREIGRQTGIKITGGVAEERVFGIYGPASTAQILNHLLDGTGSNMMLLSSETGAPAELILTPRLGGPTPPNPNAKGFDDDSGEDGDDAPRRQPQPRGMTLFGGAQPTEAPPATPVPNGFPATPAGVDANPVAAPAVNQQSPNGVKTPQEIYQQLQQLRQQQIQQQQAEPHQ